MTWENLTRLQRAEIIALAAMNGIYNRLQIIDLYNLSELLPLYQSNIYSGTSDEPNQLMSIRDRFNRSQESDATYVSNNRIDERAAQAKADQLSKLRFNKLRVQYNIPSTVADEEIETYILKQQAINDKANTSIGPARQLTPELEAYQREAFLQRLKNRQDAENFNRYNEIVNSVPIASALLGGDNLDLDIAEGNRKYIDRANANAGAKAIAAGLGTVAAAEGIAASPAALAMIGDLAGWEAANKASELLTGDTFGGHIRNTIGLIPGVNDFLYSSPYLSTPYEMVTDIAGNPMSYNTIRKGIVEGVPLMLENILKFADNIVKELNNPLYKGFDRANIKQSKWYQDLVNTYGELNANLIADFVNTDAFRNYFYGNNVKNAVKEMQLYAKARDIMSTIGGNVDEGYSAIAGSAAISKEGTLSRSTAVPHDIDANAYMSNASKLPISNTSMSELLPILFGRETDIQNAPIFETIRRSYPSTFGSALVVPISRFLRKLERVRQKLNEYIPSWLNPIPNLYYREGLFGMNPLFNISPHGANRLVTTRINGQDVDLFLLDSYIPLREGSLFLDVDNALDWKRHFVNKKSRKGRTPRAKDIADLENYRPFSAENPIINLSTGESLYAPYSFGNRLMSEEGYPVVDMVETYPGSGVKVPTIMNTKGQFQLPLRSASRRADLQVNVPYSTEGTTAPYSTSLYRSPTVEPDYSSLASRTMTFYHGSPVLFDTFSTDFIGSGEGASKVGTGINLWGEDKAGLAIKFANMRGLDTPIHLGVSSKPLTLERNPTIYTVLGNDLNFYNYSGKLTIPLEELVKLGYDGLYNGSQYTVFPESVGKLRIQNKEDILSFILNNPNIKIPEYSTFKSELDWSPENWFKYRVGGGNYTPEDAQALASHVPEYYEIERAAKLNGTWLKNADGTDWEGYILPDGTISKDPRIWVMLQSAEADKVDLSRRWFSGIEPTNPARMDKRLAKTDVDYLEFYRTHPTAISLVPYISQEAWTTGLEGAKEYAGKNGFIIELYPLKSTRVSPIIDAKGSIFNDIPIPSEYKEDMFKHLPLSRWFTDDFVSYFNNKGYGATRINNVYDATDFPIDELIIHNNTPRIFFAGNNGNLTNRYLSVAPYIIGGGAAAYTLGLPNEEYKYGGNLFVDGGDKGTPNKVYLDIYGNRHSSREKAIWANKRYVDEGKAFIRDGKVYRKSTKYLYIGSNNRNKVQANREVRLKYFDLDKEYSDSVISISNRYGLNPNVVASRIAEEGPIDAGIKIYNQGKTEGNKQVLENTYGLTGDLPKGTLISENKISTYGPNYGLDDAATNLFNGNTLITTTAPFEWYDVDFTTEHGRKTKSVVSPQWWFGIENTAAELKYRKDKMREAFPNRDEEFYDKAASVAFNRGIQGAIDYIKAGNNIDKYAPYINILKKNGGNLFYDGGELYKNTLDEVVVYPTLDILNLVAVNRALKATKPNYDFSNAVDINEDLKLTLLSRANWDEVTRLGRILDLLGIRNLAHNCINTATGWINPNSTIARNSNMFLLPEEYQYLRVDYNNVMPGDLILLKNNNSKYPYHAGIVTEIDSNGNVKAISSSGSNKVHELKDYGNPLGGIMADLYLYYRYNPAMQGAYRRRKDGALVKYKLYGGNLFLY